MKNNSSDILVNNQGIIIIDRKEEIPLSYLTWLNTAPCIAGRIVLKSPTGRLYIEGDTPRLWGVIDPK